MKEPNNQSLRADGDAEGFRAMVQAIGAEIERQCSIGAGTCGTAPDGSGLFEVQADLDLNGFAYAMLALTTDRHAEGRLAGLEELGWLAAHTDLELHHYSPMRCDDDDQAIEWRVTRVSGSINDREWTVVGRGETPLAAIQSAICGIAKAVQL